MLSYSCVVPKWFLCSLAVSPISEGFNASVRICLVTSQSSDLGSSICQPPDARRFLVKREIWMGGRRFIRYMLCSTAWLSISASHKILNFLCSGPTKWNGHPLAGQNFQYLLDGKLSWTPLLLILGHSSYILVWVTKSAECFSFWQLSILLTDTSQNLSQFKNSVLCWQSVHWPSGALPGNTALYCCLTGLQYRDPLGLFCTVLIMWPQILVLSINCSTWHSGDSC